jgi:hypothetical protein
MAVSVGAAQAAPNWTVEESAGKVVIPSVSESFGLEVSKVPVAPRLEVPSLLSLAATGVSIASSEIFGATTGTVARVNLTGMDVETQTANCQVNRVTNGDAVGTVTTAALSSELVTIGRVAYDTFKPESGTLLVEIKVETKAPTKCILAGAYKLSGSILGTAPATGVLATEQPLTFTKADEEANKASDAMKFGGLPAYLTTTIDLKLGGDQKWASTGKKLSMRTSRRVGEKGGSGPYADSASNRTGVT